MMFAQKDALEIQGLDALPDAEKPIVSGTRDGPLELHIVCRQFEYPRFDHTNSPVLVFNLQARSLPDLPYLHPWHPMGPREPFTEGRTGRPLTRSTPVY